MPEQIAPLFPLSGMNKDKAYHLLKEGEYTNALDITHIGELLNESYKIHNILGNQYATIVPATTPQNKKYRIGGYTADGVSYHNIVLYKTDGSAWGVFGFTDGATLSSTYSNIHTAINSALSGLFPVQTATYTVAADYSYFDIEIYDASIPTIKGYDYSLINTSNSPSDKILTIEIIQEGYDTSLSAQANIIGGYDSLGDLFIISTPQKYMVTELGAIITAAADNGSGLIRLTVTSSANVLNGSKIKISEGNGTTPIDGTWIAIVLNTTTIDLQNSVFSGSGTTSGNISTNIDGLGEVGVVIKNINTDLWTYKSLIKSKELNLRRDKQITGFEVQKGNNKNSIYFTDDFNFPRSMYYYGDYNNNGFLSFAYPKTGKYSYGSIALETKLTISQISSKLSFTSQSQSGGNLLSGNKRYIFRFLGESLVGTDWSDVSNPVSVFSKDTGVPSKILGDEEGVLTTKINQFTLTGIIPGLFKYVEFGVVEYIGNSITGKIISRTLLNNTSDIINLSHVGFESDTTLLDLGTIGTNNANYVRARNLTIIDKRLVLSNVSVQNQYDLSPWVSTFKYSLKKQTITGTKKAYDIGDSTVTIQLGEYLDPMNVNQFVGYMHNETYRFAPKLKFRNGGWTQNYFFADIGITEQSGVIGFAYISLVTPFVVGNLLTGQTSGATGILSNGSVPGQLKLSSITGIFQVGEIIEYLTSGQQATLTDIDSNYINRIVDLPDLALTNADASEVYVPYIEVTNMDFDYVLPDGNRIRDVFEEISFERCECIPEVLACGRLHLSEKFTIGRGIGQYTDTGTPTNFVVDNNQLFGSIISPDILLGNSSISYRAGDRLLSLGQPQTAPLLSDTIQTTPLPRIYFLDDNGDYSTNYWDDIAIEGAGLLPIGGDITLPNVTAGTTVLSAIGLNIFTFSFSDGFAVSLSGSPAKQSSGTEIGQRYVQYFRKKSNKYGNKETSQYISCGNSLKIDSNASIATTTDIFGGDTFTQKVYQHSRYKITSLATDLGSGEGFYCQSRVNEQMRNNQNQGSSVIPGLYNQATMRDNVMKFLDIQTPQGATYNNGYTVKNQVQEHIAFDPNIEQNTEHPDWITWSDLKFADGIQDNFRLFLPLNFHVLDLNFGGIVHQENGNGELLTWQPRKFMRQYFNTRGQLEVRDIGSVLIGDGSVMSRDGQTISVIGCNNKFSIIKGKSVGGNDVFVWINIELKKAVRFGYDGTKPIGDIENMQAFFANNLTWVDGKDNPTSGDGICGVWDDRHNEFIWTFRGHRKSEAWESGQDYDEDVVLYLTDETNFTTFEKTTELYLCIQPHTSGTSTKPGVGASWQTVWKLILHTDNNYFNEYTLVYNEEKNKFTSDYTPKPTIYLKYGDHFLVPRPVSDTGKIFENGIGKETTWFDDGSTKQESQAYIELLFAKDVNMVKEFFAVFVTSKIVPYKISFYTEQHETFINTSDFETELSKYVAPLKNDILSSSDGTKNDEDTTNLWGEWLRIRIYFDTAVKQQISSLVLKYFTLSRTYNK